MPSPQVQNYDPGLVITTIAAYPVVGGYAPGTYIKVSRRTESFRDDAGAQGDVVRTRSRDKRGDIELTLLRTAAANDYLTGLLLADENVGGSIVPITISDLNGTTRAFGAECWITKPPDMEEATDAIHRLWHFAVANLETFIGGNTL
jgi:hypothetical protein